MSFRNISLLGMLLMLASAVTAAVMKGISGKYKFTFNHGSLTNQTIGGVSSITCGLDSNDIITDTVCNATTQQGSLTTMSLEITSGDEHDEEGVENTTLPDPVV